MKRLRTLLLFREKFMPAAIAVSVIIGALAFGSFLKSALVSYALVSPLFHYFAYDMRGSADYYFYGNLGLSKKALWTGTAAVSLACFIISAIV